MSNARVLPIFEVPAENSALIISIKIACFWGWSAFEVFQGNHNQ